MPVLPPLLQHVFLLCSFGINKFLSIASVAQFYPFCVTSPSFKIKRTSTVLQERDRMNGGNSYPIHMLCMVAVGFATEGSKTHSNHAQHMNLIIDSSLTSLYNWHRPEA